MANAIQFPHQLDVPIIGQPYTVRGWWPSAILNCSCEEKRAVVLIDLNRPNACPACGKTFVIQGFGLNEHGQPALMIGLVGTAIPSLDAAAEVLPPKPS